MERDRLGLEAEEMDGMRKRVLVRALDCGLCCIAERDILTFFVILCLSPDG
jgi:hypothetical protein